MKRSVDILSELRCEMAKYVGKVFTQDMRQSIRMTATELMNTAIDEGQAMMCHCACTNANTDRCPNKGNEEHDVEAARKCHLEGGFEL